MMLRPRALTRDQRGFTLIEILVVVLIIAALAAIAIPAFLSQKTKASDAAAKVQARTAETAAEAYSTDHDGSYEGISEAALQAIEPALADTSSAILKVAPGATKTSYEVSSESKATGDKFTIKRTEAGGVERNCQPVSEKDKGGCPNGTVLKSGSW